MRLTIYFRIKFGFRLELYKLTISASIGFRYLGIMIKPKTQYPHMYICTHCCVDVCWGGLMVTTTWVPTHAYGFVHVSVCMWQSTCVLANVSTYAYLQVCLCARKSWQHRRYGWLPSVFTVLVSSPLSRYKRLLSNQLSQSPFDSFRAFPSFPPLLMLYDMDY